MSCDERVFVRIRNALYVSDLPSAEDEALLREHNVSGVLSALSGCVDMYSELESAVKSAGAAHEFLSMDDAPSSSLIPHLGRIRAFLDKHTTPPRIALVHCVSGVSRSTSVAIVHAVLNGVSLPKAMELLIHAHPRAAPAPWFHAELRAIAASTSRPGCSTPADAPLALRAQAMHAPLPQRSVCQCEYVRCAKCRTHLFKACAPFGVLGARVNGALLLASVDGWTESQRDKRGARLLCTKCGAKLGLTKRAVWKDGADAGIGDVFVHQVNGSCVDWPLGYQWPGQQSVVS